MIVINADGAVLGRLGAHVAKQLLKGEQIVIVNAEKTLISGSPKEVYSKYKQRWDRGNLANPKLAPIQPRVPNQLVRKAIRGMVNYRSQRGAKAYKNLKVFMGVPEEYEGKAENFVTPTPRKKITVFELSKMLGWTGGEQ